MKRLFAHFDLQRFAGNQRILGVDLTEDVAHIVEVEARGNPFKKLDQKFHPVKSISVQFLPSESNESKSEKLRSSIADNKISTKLAVTSLQTIGVKTIVTTIPSEVSDIIEWISDNMEKLTRIPISLEEVTLQYELLKRNDEYQKIIVIIAKKKDIQHAEMLLTKAGLELLSIGYFHRDTANIVPKVGNHVVCFSTAEKEQLYFFRDFSLCDYKELSSTDAVEVLKLESEKEPHQPLTVYGNVTPSVVLNSQIQSIEVPNLGSQFILSFGLGIKGFLSEQSQVNLLSNVHQQKIFDLIALGILKRAVITVGILLIVLLTVETASTIFLANKIDEIQGHLLEENSKVQELVKLQDEVTHFQSEIHKQNSSNRRTTISRSLLELSEKNVEGVSLQSVQIMAQSNKSETINIKGNAVSNESLSRYLKALQSSQMIASVDLKNSGVSQDLSGQLKSTVLFDISIVTKK